MQSISLSVLLPLVLYRIHFITTMPIVPINIPAILSLFRVARDPSLCLPHAIVPTFAELPIPLSRAFRTQSQAQEQKQDNPSIDIRAVVLDKDNCFAVPHTDSIFPAYSVRSSIFNQINESNPPFPLQLIHF